MRDIEIFIKDALPEFIDADFVFKYVASLLPQHLLSEVDVVYIGEFDHLIERGVTAIYEDGAIYVSNKQESDMDLVDDLIHEIAHSVEKKYVEQIYGDNTVEKEFKAKRKKLYDILKEKGKAPPVEMLHNISYSPELDNYFYKEVGYPILNQICTFARLFVGGYSATSVREHFATNFEQYFMGDKMLVRNFSPATHKVLVELEHMEEQ
jgi:hypothetical protein